MPSDQSLIEPQSLVLSQVTSKRKREFSIFSSPEYVYLLHLVDQRSSFLRRNMGSIKSGIIVPDSSGQLWRSSQVSNSLLLILELALQTWMQPSIKKRPRPYKSRHCRRPILDQWEQQKRQGNKLKHNDRIFKIIHGLTWEKKNKELRTSKMFLLYVQRSQNFCM